MSYRQISPSNITPVLNGFGENREDCRYRGANTTAGAIEEQKKIWV